MPATRNLAVRGACGAILLTAAALSATASGAPRAGSQTLRDVAFSHYNDYSSNSELARRSLSPLGALRMEQDLSHSGKNLTGQPINLASEKFIVYVPPHDPAQRLALLVFVPPWEDAYLPRHWPHVLDQYGVIFVSTARSGNTQSIFGRREPLAILAAINVMTQYSVDPEHVYISGFSGGSRVALRLALGYPDLFRGAILNAGSDPIGTHDLPLPPKELFLKFQSTRIAYVTGELDAENITADRVSMRSLQQWCAFDTNNFPEPRTEHTIANPAELSRALEYLLKRAPRDEGKLTACRSEIDARLTAELQQVSDLIARGQRAEAQGLLDRIDERYGGLAAPASLELARQTK